MCPPVCAIAPASTSLGPSMMFISTASRKPTSSGPHASRRVVMPACNVRFRIWTAFNISSVFVVNNLFSILTVLIKIWQWESNNPGITVLPMASSTSARLGIAVLEIAPILVILPSSTRTTAFLIGFSPVPSIRSPAFTAMMLIMSRRLALSHDRCLK